MARYGGYINGGYTTYQEMGKRSEDWNKPNYAGDGPRADRVVQHTPVVVTEYKYTFPTKVEPYIEYGVVNNKWGRTSIPAQDRPQKAEVPIISYTPNDSDSVSHGPRADRVVQHTPVVVTEYKYTSTTKVEPYNEYGVVNNKWGRTSIPAQDRPQKVEGPIISYTPNDSDSVSRGPRADRVVQHTPVVVTEYKYTSPTKVEPYNEYGVVNNKWGRTSIPAKDRPQKAEVPIISYTPNDSESVSHGPRADRIVQHTPVVVTEYKYTSPPKVEPYNEYGVVNNKWGKTSIPAEDRPQKVEEFITKVQTEVSRPARTGLLGTTNWRNPDGTNAYGEYNNFSNSDRNKPSGNTIRDESLADPFIVKKDGWGRESPKGWTNTPSHDTPLGRPTNDIGTAVEYLKEVVQSSSVTSPPTQPRFGAPISTVTRKEIYTETIDSKEAARRYGNCNLASRPLRTEETYTGTIDSREAAKKYNGASV